MDAKKDHGHLTDPDLFGLALPPAGEPEALPAHLSECGACGRALQTWKEAVRDLASEDAGPMGRRTPAEWAVARERTLSAIRTSRPGRAFPLRRALGLAAAVLLAVLLLPLRRGPAEAPSRAGEAAEELSAADLADDTLLRDAAREARGDSAGVWNAFTAEPGETGRSEDGKL